MAHKKASGKKEERILDAYIKFSRAATSLENQLSRSLVEKGLTLSQFSVMEVVHHLGPLNQKDIAEKILTSNSNLVTVIDNLEKNELVRRERDRIDRRNFIVHLTDKGKKVITELFNSHVQLIIDRFSVLNAHETETLGKLSKKIGLNTDQ